MRQRSLVSDMVISGSAIVIAIVALATMRVDDVGLFLAFTALIAASELFEVSLPHDVRYALGLGPAIGLALLGSIRPEPVAPPLAAVLGAFAIGVSIALAIRALQKKEWTGVDAAGRMLALAAGAGIYRVFVAQEGLPVFDVVKSPGSTDVSYFGFAAILVTVLLVQTAVTAARTAERDRVPAGPVFRGTLESSFALQLSVVSVGALLAVVYPALSYWSFPLFLAPLAATQFAFRQFASIRRTYLQTIRALSKVPEMAGYTNPGHSQRVATMSMAIGREIGVPEAELNEIEYAALLHDIGRVSIPDPTQATGSSTMELAIVGAQIIRETGHFPRVAEMIEHQHDPYRRRGEGPNTNLQIGAKIIKVASAYDDLVREDGVGLTKSDALDRLSLGMAFDFDPEVVHALRRVLSKQPEAGAAPTVL